MTWHDATVLTIAFGAFACGWATGRYQGTGRRLRQPKSLYGMAGFIEGPVAASNRPGPRTAKPRLQEPMPIDRSRGGYQPMPDPWNRKPNPPPRNP